MTDTNNPRINPQKLFDLYFRQEYDRLSEQFLQVLSYFERHTHFELLPDTLYFVNIFTKNFLYLFTQPDYILSDRHVPRFIQLNLTISNLVAISSLKNTDFYLEILRNQPRNFAKILTLYSARNQVKFDRKTLFDANSKLACLWYSVYCDIYRSGLVNPIVYQNIKQHLSYEDERLTEFHHVEDVYFGATYIDSNIDRKIKQKINQAIQNNPLFSQLEIRNHPQPKKLAVITALWFSQHSVYRTLAGYIESLQDDYEITLIHLGDTKNYLDIGSFQGIRYINIQNNSLNLDAIRDNNFTVAYYPDIGMSAESIFLSNLRIAPIQISGTGHPVSTFGSKIDYFLSGADVEITEKAAENYSERLVLIPGFGAIHKQPNYQIKNPENTSLKFIINCSWFAQKVNYPLLRCLQEIATKSEKEILFRFFSGVALLRKNDFLPFQQNVEAMLGKERVEVVTPKPYQEYMSLMEEGKICIEAYHFGGSNTVADSLYLRKPTVTWSGKKWYNRIGAQMLRTVGLEELIANSKKEYIYLILKLIHDDRYRVQIQEKLQQVDLSSTVFSSENKPYFKKAINFLVANHQQLQEEKSREAIIIS
ncbi:MAG: hypothetical protein SAL07_06365 [Oscillatoria sp. PMC 1051.18]|nr:hypothetical protein [Oscillatoria sp. PMC 1050.18]MEC5029518.1 hypothetical protein [Oscillatoria sp. PMC 1051.18]